MAVIDVRFDFSRDLNNDSVNREIEVTGGLMSDIDDCRDELLEELWDGEDEEWEFVEFEVECFDGDYAAPSDFNDLDEYGEYVEKCEEHGEGYRLRYDDIGENDFDDEYAGCWESAEDFVQQQCEDCYDIPDHLANYIDWESMARDWMMDYSEYDGREGVHIFRS
jgi:antirestriction protein